MLAEAGVSLVFEDANSTKSVLKLHWDFIVNCINATYIAILPLVL